MQADGDQDSLQRLLERTKSTLAYPHQRIRKAELRDNRLELFQFSVWVT